jgi:hypothetical protein
LGSVRPGFACTVVGVTFEPPSFEEGEEEPLPSRRRFWTILIAIILIVSVGLVYGADALFTVAPNVLRSSGDPDDYAFLQVDRSSGDPIRYDPCSPIRYVVNRSAAPEGAVADLERSIALFEEAMDADFAFEGFTDEAATPDRRIYQPDRYPRDEWAPILFSWVPPERLLQPNEQAVGAAGSAYVRNDRGNLVYVTGTVTFNSEARLLPGFELGDSWGDVTLHELGHIVGLAHVNDSTQVMYPDVTGGEARLGAGDLAGLERLGRAGGCVEVPPPG